MIRIESLNPEERKKQLEIMVYLVKSGKKKGTESFSDSETG